MLVTPYVSNFTYTASSGISQMKLGNGKWETAVFNERLQVTDLGLGSSATDFALWKTHYDYGELSQDGSSVDAAKNTGNIARQTLTVSGTSFTQSYRYDPLYRLTEARETSGTTQNWIQNWAYDRYGNRSSFTQSFAGSTNPTVPTVDQSTNRFNTGQGFAYDKNGNVTQDTDPITSLNRTFVFNGDNKQITVTDSNGNDIGQYFYDGEGKRVKKVIPATGETTVFVYSSGKLIAEYSTQTNPNPAINYTTTDHLGSPRVITDQFGQVISRRDFLPFGEEIDAGIGARSAALSYSSATDSLRQKFTGYQKDDETSLDFAEARMYENRFGRFTAVDPLLASGKSANPQTFNRYAYIANNPLIASDPTGMDPWWTRKIKDQAGRSEYKESKDRPDGEDWELVDFKGGWYTTVDQWNTTGKTAYLYASGGQDMGRRFKWATYQMQLSQCAPAYQCTGLNPDFDAEGAGQMWLGTGGAVYNPTVQIYNLPARGLNYFGGSSLPLIPEYEPQTPRESAAYYATSGLMLFEGGVSAYRGIASGVNTIRTGGLSFSAYKASKGGSEILGTIPTVTRSGRTIDYAIRTEYSHMFITQATQRTYSLPNWLVNNRINVWKLNTIQHALVDPLRFRTLPVGLKPRVGWTLSNSYNIFTRSF